MQKKKSCNRRSSRQYKKLKEDGHTLYIITARWLASPKTDKTFKQAQELREKMRKTVKEWLERNQIIYDNIIFLKKISLVIL